MTEKELQQTEEKPTLTILRKCGQAVIRLQAYNWYKLQFSNGLLVITFWSSRNVSKLVPLSEERQAVSIIRSPLMKAMYVTSTSCRGLTSLSSINRNALTSFLKLPAELRENILRLVVGDQFIHVRWTHCKECASAGHTSTCDHRKLVTLHTLLLSEE